MVLTFKELSLIAELHYEKLPGPFKQQATEFFDALDQDGDGAVTLRELLDSNLAAKFGEGFIQDAFFNLDEEGKTLLEFKECLTLYYLCMYSTRICAACEKNIPHGLGYTCRTCRRERQPPNSEFCVCLECFSSHNYQHEHGPHHFFHDFVLFDELLHSRPSSPTRAPVRIVQQTVKQCVVCGDYHESGARGFTCDVHMSPMRGSSEFVCEWCFSYLCSKCGILYRDSSTRAEPGKWLQRFVCPTCHERNIPLDRYEACLKRVQNKLSGADLLKQCKTCGIKHKNGTLFWYVNGTNTAAAPAPAPAPPSQPAAWQAPAPPMQQAPAPGPRGRGGSSVHAPTPRRREGPSEFPQRQPLSCNSSSGSSSDGHSVRSSQDSGSGSSHRGAARVNPGGPNNRVNMRQPPPPRGAARGAPPLNRPNVYDAAAVAVRQVNRFVNASAANVFGGGRGRGRGRGGPTGGSPGVVDGGGGGMAYNGGGGGDGGADAYYGGAEGDGGADAYYGDGSDANYGGAEGDGGDADYGGDESGGFLAGLSNFIGGGDEGGDSEGFLSSLIGGGGDGGFLSGIGSLAVSGE